MDPANNNNENNDLKQYEEKMSAMRAEIDSLKTAMENKEKEMGTVDKKPTNNQRDNDIKTAQLQDLQAQKEAMFHEFENKKNDYMEEMKETFQLDQLMGNVASTKKDELKDILAGKTRKEQIDYIEKYRAKYFIDGGQYLPGGNGKPKNPEGDALKMMMNGNFIVESGLTEADVKEFIDPNSIAKFEKTLLREYKSLKSPDAVHNFFSKER